MPWGKLALLGETHGRLKSGRVLSSKTGEDVQSLREFVEPGSRGSELLSMLRPSSERSTGLDPKAVLNN